MKAILELNGSPVGVRLLFDESGVPAGARPDLYAITADEDVK